jgi:hypothetical protein
LKFGKIGKIEFPFSQKNEWLNIHLKEKNKAFHSTTHFCLRHFLRRPSIQVTTKTVNHNQSQTHIKQQQVEQHQLISIK